MALTRTEAHEQILGDLQSAIEALDLAVACIGEAYEHLDEESQDRLDSTLFRPIQRAYGQAKKTQARFAEQTGASTLDPEPAGPGLASQGAQSFIEQAVEAAADGDSAISDLQDSMLPIEFGDPELRASLAAIREPLAEVPRAAQEFIRTLGR